MSILQNGILNDYNTTITLLDRTSYTTPDIYGGIDTTGYQYTKGATIGAQIIPQETTAAQIAQAITEKKYYTVVVDKGNVFDKGQVFLDNKDNQTYRITEGNANHSTPDSAGLQFTYAKAELWELPADTPLVDTPTNNNSEP